MLKAWEGVFPGSDQARRATCRPDLQAHFRYPQDLFEVQRSLLVRYHVDDPVDFFQSSGFWKVPNDPTVSEAVQAPQPPYYLQVKLPGQETSDFELTSVLTGFQREFMSAYVAASSDPDNYGQLTVLRLPTSTQTPGPAQVQQLFRTTQEISSLVTLSTQQGGSRVIFGNLLTLPVNDGLLYVEPFYIQGQASSTVVPAAEPGAGLVRRPGRGRRDAGPGAHQGRARVRRCRRRRSRAVASKRADDRRRLRARGRDGDVDAAGHQHGARRRPTRRPPWPRWTRRRRRSMPRRRPVTWPRSARRARSSRTRSTTT